MGNETTPIDNMADMLDSRDIIERIEYLQGEDNLTDDERAELSNLDDLAAVASDFAADWHYGETLIRDSYFTEYAQELAEDIGAIDANATWPNTCIDWEHAAHELRMDYTGVEFDGVTYWTR